MSKSAADGRTTAARVAKALRDKGRVDEAVLVLSAWAVAGPSDPQGHELLAEALRLDPSSSVAKMAFERMEGVSGEHGPLDAAAARFTAEELSRLDRELRPVFRRAQVGFNNNVKYKGQHYHVQTEDSGLDKPHVITHLFADGGRIIKSFKRSYADAVARDDVATFVKALMKGQHMEMVVALRDGRFDGVIEGREAGGMAVLEHPPVVAVARVGGEKKEPRDAPAAAPKADAKEPVRMHLHVLRSLAGGPETYEPAGDVVILGSGGAVSLTGERFCHPHEAALEWRDGTLALEDFEGGNGVFVRIRRRVEIGAGDEFVIGDQLLRLEKNPDADDGPDPGPTYFRSSPRGASSFRVIQVFEGGAVGACAMARESTLQVGSALDYANDLVVARDPLVAAFHCVIEEQAGSFVLSDLGAKSGVFVRLAGRQKLGHGDELLVGRTRLLVDLTCGGSTPLAAAPVP